MRSFIKWIQGNPLRKRAAVALLAVLVVAAWRAGAWATLRSARALADDLASVGVFVGPALPNPACNQLLFAQTTEQGLGIYTVDLKTGLRNSVKEFQETRVLSGTVKTLGWSPDGSLFAYSRPAKGRKQNITLCSGYVGAGIQDILCESPVENFAWLSSRGFAYTNRKREIRFAAQESRGRWNESLACRREADIVEFHAISQAAVAWREGNSVYRMNLAGGQPELVWAGRQDSWMRFSFSREKNTYLIGEDSDNGYVVRTLYVGPPRLTNSLCVIQDRTISGLKWVNGGRNFLLVCSDPVGKTLLVGSEEGKEMTPLFEAGNANAITPQGSRLYIVGSTNVEPPGVWEYDFSVGGLRCVLNGSDKGEALYRSFQHEAGVLTNGTREVTYHLWTPKPTMFKRRFPIVIGQTPYAWSPYPYMAVNSGYCFATVDRPAWYTGLDTWSDDVQLVLERLRSHRRVDVSEAYLYARSAETSPLSQLIQENPGRWKGMLMFSPGALPQTANTGWKMLVDIGEFDHGARERLSKYQAEAARNGVPVRLLVHETARHTSWSRATQRARLEDLGEWLR